MKVKHNKKRNVGLLFAQLSQYISEALVEGDIGKSKIALEILKKHFTPNTELIKEFRLFRAMMITEVPSPALANSIISEAKAASRKLDMKILTQQKSALIKDINYNLSESVFYSRRVPEYKIFATLQTLMSEWRSSSPDLVVTGNFEGKLHDHLLCEKPKNKISDIRVPDINNLVVDIMHEKIEEEYGSTLSPEQVTLLRAYVFSNENEEHFQHVLQSVKKQSLKCLSSFSASCNNEILSEQVEDVRKQIITLDTQKINDDSISQYLTLMRLTEEITNGDESNV